MILVPPESVRKLQTALQAKAKSAPNYRFYLLHDKLYRKDVPSYAYRRCKANKGAAGIDGQEFVDIEAYGEERWLGPALSRDLPSARRFACQKRNSLSSVSAFHARQAPGPSPPPACRSGVSACGRIRKYSLVYETRSLVYVVQEPIPAKED